LLTLIKKGVKSPFKLFIHTPPDKGGDVDMFKIITEAYNFFDEDERLKYDTKVDSVTYTMKLQNYMTWITQ
jgi:hypothetical protein